MVIPTSPSSFGAASLLVGRDREVGILREHLATARAGQGNLVLISGEAGVGKTALAEVVCDSARQQGACVLVGRCFDLAETPPYGPWMELFRQYRSVGRGYVGSTPSLPDAFAQNGAVGGVTSQTMLFQQVEDFFMAVAAQSPLVLLLDDLHWADPASLDLLRFLARSLSTLPILVIVMYRGDELARQHPLHTLIPLLERESGATPLDLHRLSHEAIQTLVATLYHLPDADASRLITYLTARSAGNALFIVQLLRALEERGLLRRVDDWIVGDLDSVGVPLSLQQVIDGRVMRLGADIQRPLAMAAVIGQEVPVGLWATVTAMDEETTLMVVERAAAARLLEATPDGERVRFVHALIREALYEAIPPLRRRVWHRQVAEAVAHLPHPDTDSIADHFQRAGDARAMGWLIKAGDHAQQIFARATASARYEAAGDLMEQYGAEAGERGWLRYRLATARSYEDTPYAIARLQEAAHLAESANDRVLLANALGFAGNLRVMYGEVRQGMADMERSSEIFASLSPIERARLATLDVFWVYDGDLIRGARLADLGNAGYYTEALALGAVAYATACRPHADGREVTRIGTVEKGIALAYAALGRPEEARQAFVREREARQRRGYTPALLAASALNELRYVVLPYQTDDIVGRRQLAALAETWYVDATNTQQPVPLQPGRLPLLVLEGQWGEARAVASTIVSVGWHGAFMDHARSELGLLARLQGEPALAQRMVDAELPAGCATPPGGTPCFLDALLAQRLAAALALDAGDLTTAHDWVAMHDRWLSWSGSVRGRSEGETLWAEYFRAAGERERAWRHAMSALAHATTPRQPLAALVAHRLLGELATEMGQFDSAAKHLDSARALAEACAAPYEKALTLIALAALLRVTGDGDEALALLDEVRAICTPLDARPALAQADALAARIVKQDAPPAYPAELSAREVEVLRLMAKGETNRGIAAALFLSERTINKHVTHILTKTGTDNRTAAAAFAHRHGLT